MSDPDSANTDDIRTRCAALLKPQRETLDQDFQKALKSVRSRAGQADWTMERDAAELAEKHASSVIVLTANCVRRVISVRNLQLTEKDIVALLNGLRPDINDLKRFAYENIRGIGLPTSASIEIAIENALRLSIEHETADLALLAVPSPDGGYDSTEHAGTLTEQFIVPDTQVVLHFKPIWEIDPRSLGVTRPATWLIVDGVIRELDIQKGTGEKRLRSRARRAVREFERLESEGTKLVGNCVLRSHIRTGAFNFSARGLMQNEGDDKIIADILDFKSTHRADEVFLLTDDYHMRLRARKHDIKTLSPSDDLRLPDLEDERDRQIRELRDRNQDLEKTNPDLDIGFDNLSNSADVEIFTFSQEELEEVVSQVTTPQDSTLNKLDELSLHAALGFPRPNPNYEAQLQAYSHSFREYFYRSWVCSYRTINVNLTLASKNGVQANRVTLKLRFNTVASVINEAPESPERPSKPQPTYLQSILGGPMEASPSIFDAVTKLDSFSRIRLRYPDEPQIVIDDSAVMISYSFGRIQQRESVKLKAFYLSFSNDVSPEPCIPIRYEIRAENMYGVKEGTLLLAVNASQRFIPATYGM